MEHDLFDALIRTLSTTESRRGTLRALAGTMFSGVCGGIIATLGAGEDTAAKARKHGKGKTTRHGSNRVKSEGKRGGKGKKDKRHRKSPPPLPPGCQDCNECQMCQDGACEPDPDLNGIICQGSGAACGYCQGGVCAPSSIPRCTDGICPSRSNKCCSDEKLCPDRESSTGFICVGKDDCCPDQKRCAGTCIYKQACCEADRPQNCGQCGASCHVDGTWACSAAKPCDDGSCIAQDDCCPGDQSCGICPHGSPDFCTGDFSQFKCGAHPSCLCLRTTAGATQCVDVLSAVSVHCEVDADCDLWLGHRPGMCEQCSHHCYAVGCPA